MAEKKRVALVTCSELVELDEDGPLLRAALQELGIDSLPVVWDDPRAAWHSFDVAVVRSSWDYARRRDEFLEWSRGVAKVVPLVNPPDILEWNTDKRYLRQLDEAGVRVVETHWPDLDEPIAPPHVGDDFVVKPNVSAGCKDTGRFTRAQMDEAKQLAAAIFRSGRRVMVQPYVPSVDDRGETAMMFFGGEFSHAIRKGGMLKVEEGPAEGLFKAEEISHQVASGREIELAKRAIEVAAADGGTFCYARVDLVHDSDGLPRVIELELTEPSLFLGYHRQAPARFAAAIRGALESAFL